MKYIKFEYVTLRSENLRIIRDKHNIAKVDLSLLTGKDELSRCSNDQSL